MEIKPRIIIFYYEWPNTAGNHAGMAYFANRLKRDLDLHVKLVKAPKNYGKYPNRLQMLWRQIVIRYILIILKDTDVIFFMEYLGGRQCGDNREIALILRARGIENRFIGLIHLPMNSLSELYERDYIYTGLNALSEIVVFGSSLAKDIGKLGFGNKTQTTYHYVDTDFYRPSIKGSTNFEFVVIVMGFLYRNREILKEIIERCPDINFQLCLGNNQELHALFFDYKNVNVNGFIAEYALLEKMQSADASLSVMDDTIGSNVITTSLACGLPQVVSDVGSIRDYCNDKNSIFCKTKDDFVNSLYTLKENEELCQKMGLNARKKAESISLEKSIDWYRKLLSSSTFSHS